MIEMLWYGLLCAMAAASLIAFALYGTDKRRAKSDPRHRIRERTLLLWAACLGGCGAWLGMRVFRHKTKHTKFRVLVPLCALVQLAALGLVYYYL